MVNKTYLIAFVVALSTIASTISDDEFKKDLANNEICENFCRGNYIYEKGIHAEKSNSKEEHCNCVRDTHVQFRKDSCIDGQFDFLQLKTITTRTRISNSEVCTRKCKGHYVKDKHFVIGIYFKEDVGPTQQDLSKIHKCACYEENDRRKNKLDNDNDLNWKTDSANDDKCDKHCKGVNKNSKHYSIRRIFHPSSLGICECYLIDNNPVIINQGC